MLETKDLQRQSLTSKSTLRMVVGKQHKDDTGVTRNTVKFKMEAEEDEERCVRNKRRVSYTDRRGGHPGASQGL